MRTCPHWLRLAAISALVCASGCEYFRNARANNPVIPVNPPRIAPPAGHEGSAAWEPPAAREPSQIELASGERPAEAKSPGRGGILFDGAKDLSRRLDGSDVVAFVNGEAILASDILQRYAEPLRQAELRAPPLELEAMKRELIQRDLPDQIDRTLLVQSIRRNIPEAQLAGLKKHIEELFNEEVSRMMREMQVGSKVELEEKLNERGTSLAELRNEFELQRMALEYLQSRAFKEVEIGRRDLLAYYNEHAADYDVPGRARWQQITLSFRRFHSRDEARSVMDRIVKELAGGAPFEDLARKYSDGPNAKRGGMWDWTTQGSLADREVDRWLFEGPVGETSPIIESKDALKLVRIVERRPAHRIPFEQVQAEIREHLTRQARRNAAREVLDKLRGESSIATMFDRAEESPIASGQPLKAFPQ